MAYSVKEILSYLKIYKKTAPPLLYKVTRQSIKQHGLPLYETVVNRDFINVEPKNHIPCYIELTMSLVSNPMLCCAPLRLPDGSLSSEGHQIASFLNSTVYQSLHKFNFLSEQELQDYREGLDELANMNFQF